MRLLAFISGLALLASTAAYCATFFNIDVHRALPNIWLLHLGMFAVLIPTALLLPKSRFGSDFRWGDLLSYYPRVLRWLTAGLLVFAFVNVAAFEVMCGPGGPSKQPDGTYALTSHGRVIRSISEAEYERARGFEFRSFSCWWMLCYCFALTLQLAELRRRGAISHTIL